MYDLFGNVLSKSIVNKKDLPKKNKTKWSYSRRETMNQCLRKYYYTYFAKSDNINAYKKLSNKHLIVGDIIHSTIEKAFKDFKHSQKEWNIDDCIEYGIGSLKSTLYITSEYEKNKKIFIPDTVKIFQEIVLDGDNIRDIKNECDHIIITSLNNLYHSYEFGDILDGVKSFQAEIEKDISLQLTNTITIYGKIDILYPVEDGLMIADWKTGKDIVEDSSLQLSAYGLWASNIKCLTPDKVFIQKAYLYADESMELQFNDIHLERAKVRIIQDAEIMEELSEFGNNHIVDAFDKCGYMIVCNQCQFKNLCY